MEPLKKKDAYRAMFLFLEDRYSRLPSDDLGNLLGELQLNDNDGAPFDSAIVEGGTVLSS